MGQLSLGHWIVVFAVVLFIGAVFGALMKRGAIRSRIARISERSAYGSAVTSPDFGNDGLPEKPSASATPTGQKRSSFVLLPAVMVVWGIALLLGLILGNGTPNYGNIESNSIFIAGICLAVAFIIHMKPNHSRSLKYTLVIAPYPIISLFAYPRFLLHTSAFSSVFNLLCMLLWYVPIIIFLSVFGASWLNKMRDTGVAPRRYEYLLLGFLRSQFAGPALIVIYFVCVKLALPILFVRYLIIERFRLAPIVYLRSFAYEGAARVFGSAIAPGLSRYGVVTGLVHQRQTSSVLMARTSVWQFGTVATVPDQWWREWVERSLSTASFAVIDHSVVTESVEWEIATTARLMPRGRVLALVNEQAEHSSLVDSDVKTYAYDIGDASLQNLRRNLNDWASDQLFVPYSPSKEGLIWVVLFIGAFVLYQLPLTYMMHLRFTVGS